MHCTALHYSSTSFLTGCPSRPVEVSEPDPTELRDAAGTTPRRHQRAMCRAAVGVVHCRAPEKAFETLRVDFPPPPPSSAPPPYAPRRRRQRHRRSSLLPSSLSSGSGLRSIPPHGAFQTPSQSKMVQQPQPQCSSLACFGGFSNVYFVLLSLAVRSSGALSTLFFPIFLLLYCAAPLPRLQAAGFCAAAAVHHGALTDSECWDPNSFYFGTTLGSQAAIASNSN